MSGGAVVFMKDRGARASLPAPLTVAADAHPTVARSSFPWCQPVPKAHSNPDVQRQGCALYGCVRRLNR